MKFSRAFLLAAAGFLALGAGTVAGTGLTYGPYNDAYKRHSFFSEVRVVNLSSRRENP